MLRDDRDGRRLDGLDHGGDVDAGARHGRDRRASTGAAVRITVSSPERPATYPPAAPAATAARVNPAAAANRCGRRRPWWDRPAGAAGAVGGADECDQGGEEDAPGARRGGPEGPVAGPVGGDNGARPDGGRSGRCGAGGGAGRTRLRACPGTVRPPQERRENQGRTLRTSVTRWADDVGERSVADSRRRLTRRSRAGVGTAPRASSYDGAVMVERDGGAAGGTAADGTRAAAAPVGAPSSPVRPAASAPRSPARSPRPAPPSACSTSSPDVKALAAELGGPAAVADLARPGRHPPGAGRADRRASAASTSSSTTPASCASRRCSTSPSRSGTS